MEVRKMSTTLYEKIYKQIKLNIMVGVYKPGEKLPDARLAEELGTSRTPIREALHQLAKDGLIVNEPNKVATVYKPTLYDIAEIYASRAYLEGMAAWLAAKNEKRKQYLYYMMEELERSERSFEEGDTASIAESNVKFHDLIIESSMSERIKKLTEPLRLISAIMRRESLAYHEHSQMSLTEHRAIFEMIKQGLSDEAEKFVHRHIMTAGYRFLKKEGGREFEEIPLYDYFHRYAEK